MNRRRKYVLEGEFEFAGASTRQLWEAVCELGI